MDEIKPHHWITSVGLMSRRKPPKQCQPAAYYDQQAIDTLRAEVGRLRTLLADWHSQSTCKDGLRVQSPGHAHGKIGVWDDDNGAFAGVECAQCRLWAEAAAIDAAKQGAE